ncbi:F-box/LRR-repeat protein At3g26922-like [Salvia miltiorrhiza]|uniref:F-box/LRR-repeat protein At3g26922-like n=1 Tax=Salvia miltiorrhiza TaxID=226208 RepID=UPI0025ABB4F9|nr:F-box/LRR-repeat protein At3g26922-like [Salvia miltiorrhiza]
MEEDRISQLPDAILQQILSLIDINQAVETAVLSSRWKNLWFSLSDLNFHLTRFPHFISNFLSHRDDAAPIRNFHLSLDTGGPAHEFVEECAYYAVSHGVQSLRLHAPGGPLLNLPAAFFASTTLRELHLRQFSGGISLPGNFCLPHLKTLYLESTRFFKHDFLYTILKEPFSRFPELEKLTLRRCMLYRLVVKAPKLRFLEIIQERLEMEEISAPLLTWFRYEGHYPFECPNVNLPVLEEVNLDIYKRFYEEGMRVKCVRMLQQLGNATTVALTLDILKVLGKDRSLIEQKPCPFPYLKCLKLMKGRREIPRVLQSVMKYLSESAKVEFPDGVSVVEEYSGDEDDSDDELELPQLFGIEDET